MRRSQGRIRIVACRRARLAWALVFLFSTLMPSRPLAGIRVDGADADWSQVHTRYSEGDVRKDGTASKAFLALASDDSTLYLNWRDGAASGPGETAELCLDADGSESTGLKGYDACLILGNPHAESGPVPVPVTLYAAGKVRVKKSAGKRAPVLPGFTRGIECGVPFNALGLHRGSEFRFILRYGKAYLKGYADISASRMRYRPGSAMGLDGLEDGWENVAEAWADPPDPKSRPDRDPHSFKVAADSQNLYFYWRTAGAWADSALPTLTLAVRPDPSPGKADTVRVLKLLPYRPGGSGPRDWGETAVALGRLGLAADERFRFTACIEAGACLQGYQEIDSTRLYFPSRTMNLGTQISGLNPADLDSLLNAYSRLLMDGRTFRAGRYFNVQLAVHGDDGSDMASGMPAPGRYDFRKLTSILEIFRAHKIAYFPLIQYHYLPAWFQARHDSLYGQTRPVDRSGKVLPPGNAFLPVIPDAPGYRSWSMDFTKEATHALLPYLGTTVPMILTGNEVTYPGGRADSYSFDTAFTLKAWRRFRNDPKAAFPPMATPEFCRFRSQHLVELLKGWTRTAQEAEVGAVPVSTKLAPYGFFAGELRQNGYFPYVSDYLDQPFLKSIAVDAYPPDWTQLQPAYRLGKPMSITEYSYGSEGRKDPLASPSRLVVAGWLESAVRNFGMEAAFFYSWNSADSRERIYPEQLRGIRDAMERILGMEKPVVRTRLVRGVLPGDDFILTGDMGMAHPEVMQYLHGWVCAAAALQASHPDIAFELGNQQGVFAPDVRIRGLQGLTALSPEQVRYGKSIYMLRDIGAEVRIGKHRVKLAGEAGNRGNSDCRLAEPLAGQSAGSLLMSWTPAWFRGGKFLETDLPGAEKDSAMGVRVLAQAEGKPVILMVGRRSVFMASDLFWHIGQSRGDTVSMRFLSNLIQDLLKD